MDGMKELLALPDAAFLSAYADMLGDIGASGLAERLKEISERLSRQDEAAK